MKKKYDVIPRKVKDKFASSLHLFRDPVNIEKFLGRSSVFWRMYEYCLEIYNHCTIHIHLFNVTMCFFFFSFILLSIFYTECGKSSRIRMHLGRHTADFHFPISVFFNKKKKKHLRALNANIKQN